MDISLFPNLTPTIAAMAAIDLVIILGALALARFGFARMITDQPVHDLTVRDNPATGIFVAGGAVAIAIVLAGAADGPYALTLDREAATFAATAAAGLVLLFGSALAANRLQPTHSQIREHNTAAAATEAGRLVATALILHGALTVAPATWPAGPVVLLGAFLASVAILALIAAVRGHVFKARNDGETFSAAIANGNTALALRFAGYQIGVAIAVAATGPAIDIVDWTAAGVTLMATEWAIHAVVAAAATLLLTAIAERTVLAGIPTSREVDRERNLGVGTIEAATAIGAGLAVASVIS